MKMELKIEGENRLIKENCRKIGKQEGVTTFEVVLPGLVLEDTRIEYLKVDGKVYRKSVASKYYNDLLIIEALD